MFSKGVCCCGVALARRVWQLPLAQQSFLAQCMAPATSQAVQRRPVACLQRNQFGVVIQETRRKGNASCTDFSTTAHCCNTAICPNCHPFMPHPTHVLQDPHDRATAGELLTDPWLVSSTKTLKMSWNKTAGLVRRGLKKPSDAHKTLASVMQRMMDHNGAQPSHTGAATTGSAPRGPSPVGADLTAPEPSGRRQLQEFPSRSFREKMQAGNPAAGPPEPATTTKTSKQGWDDTAKRGSGPGEEPPDEQVRHIFGLTHPPPPHSGISPSSRLHFPMRE